MLKERIVTLIGCVLALALAALAGAWWQSRRDAAVARAVADRSDQEAAKREAATRAVTEAFEARLAEQDARLVKLQVANSTLTAALVDLKLKTVGELTQVDAPVAPTTRARRTTVRLQTSVATRTSTQTAGFNIEPITHNRVSGFFVEAQTFVQFERALVLLDAATRENELLAAKLKVESERASVALEKGILLEALAASRLRDLETERAARAELSDTLRNLTAPSWYTQPATWISFGVGVTLGAGATWIKMQGAGS